MPGVLYLDDLAVGRKFVTHAVTLTLEGCKAFAAEFDPQPFHLDEEAARRSVFGRIAVPLALPALLSALAVAWARALGEFGATLVFAGNLPGMTQTLPIAIYATMEGDLGPARAMAIVLLAWAIVLFAVLRRAPFRRRRE